MSLKRENIVEQKEVKILYVYFQTPVYKLIFFFPDMKVIDSERQR